MATTPSAATRRSRPASVPGLAIRLKALFGWHSLGTGAWDLEVSFDGRPLMPRGRWEEVCCVSDEIVDHLDLELSLSEGFRVERQLFLARKDRFLLLADAVLGSRPGHLEYRWRLPLGRGISFQGAEETREGVLCGKRPRALVLPLALPEWRCDPQPGSLAQTDRGLNGDSRSREGEAPAEPSKSTGLTVSGAAPQGPRPPGIAQGCLELRQEAQGTCLFAPLFVDLVPRRFAQPFTWRQLTVAENLTVQPCDVAVGYRVLVGKRQWLIYRALARKANRTLLGHNLSSEMLVARFGRKGEVKPLLEME